MSWLMEKKNGCVNEWVSFDDCRNVSRAKNIRRIVVFHMTVLFVEEKNVGF